MVKPTFIGRDRVVVVYLHSRLLRKVLSHTMAQELATYAGLRSAQVLWGGCYEVQGMPPYWPWVQAIRSYVREHEPDQLRSELGTRPLMERVLSRREILKS